MKVQNKINQPAIYLTNLGKYNEGELVGQWLNVPCSNDEFKKALLNIGVDGVQYEEYFITDFEYLNGLSEYSNIQEVNEIAKKELEKMTNSLKDLKELIFIANEKTNGGYEHTIKYPTSEFWGMLEVREESQQRIANMVAYGNYNPLHGFIGYDRNGNIESMTQEEYESDLKSFESEILENL